MKIQDREISASDLGRGVAYIPRHANGDIDHTDVEHGLISSIGETGVFVRYFSKSGVLQSTPAGTNPTDLRWEVPLTVLELEMLDQIRASPRNVAESAPLRRLVRRGLLTSTPLGPGRWAAEITSAGLDSLAEWRKRGRL